MKRVTRVFLFCAVVFVGLCGSACGSSPPPVDDKEDLSFLKELYRKAVRLPFTPYMVKQIQSEQGDDFFAKLRYYSSVDIEVTHQYGGGPSLRIETQALRDVKVEREVLDDLEVYTFREGDPVQDQNRISREEGGQLVRRSPAGDVFEIQYHDRPFILGFVLDPEKHWYNLEFALDKAGGKRIPLIMTGSQPHLTINYRNFFTTQESRIQLMGSPDLSGRQGGNSGEAGLQSYLPPKAPAGVPNRSPKGDLAAGRNASYQTEDLIPAGSLRSLDDVPRWDRRSSSVDRVLIEDGDAYVPEVVFVESSGRQRGWALNEDYAAGREAPSPSKSLIPVAALRNRDDVPR